MVMHEDDGDSSSDEYIDYKSQCSVLKKKLYCLMSENEAFTSALKLTQRKLLKASREKNFLLDRLLEYEKPRFNSDSSSGEETESSDDDEQKSKSRKRPSTSSLSSSSGTPTVKVSKPRKKSPVSDRQNYAHSTPSSSSSSIVTSSSPTQVKPSLDEFSEARSPSRVMLVGAAVAGSSSGGGPSPTLPAPRVITQRQSSIDGHMTPEEVEKHLESTRQRQSSAARQELYLKSALDPGAGAVYDDVGASPFLEETVVDILSEPRSL